MTIITERVIGECYSCAAQIEITDQMPGEIVNCPDCGLELELALYKSGTKGKHGSIFLYDYNRQIGQYTLAQAPEEDEDWGE